MTSDEIILALSQRLANCGADPAELIFTFSMRDLLAAIVRRIGEEALSLTDEQLLSARDDLCAVIAHYLDEREVLDLTLDQWDATRKL